MPTGFIYHCKKCGKEIRAMNPHCHYYPGMADGIITVREACGLKPLSEFCEECENGLS